MKSQKLTKLLMKPFGASVKKGMTLIEIMIVVALIGTLMTILIRSITGQRDKTMIDAAHLAANQLAQSLEMYKVHMYRFPNSSQGLDALVTEPSGSDGKKWRGPYTDKKKLDDPWGNKFSYESDGRTFKIVSAGPDGQMGNEDDVAYPDEEGDAAAGNQPISGGAEGGGEGDAQ
jgi:general secretion pathway protein G